MIKDFSFYMPVKVIFGPRCVLNNASEYAALGKKALIVTGKTSAKASGALDDIILGLTKNAQEYAVYDGSVPNPSLKSVYDGAEAAKREKADFIIAIGGGSPMDTAKAIAVLAVNDLSEERLFANDYKNALPMVFIPTTAGTGSEVTQYSVLTNDKIESKQSISSPVLFPKIAFLDARYCESMSYKTTLYTAVDALSHSVEGMLTKRANIISDTLAEKSISLIRECLPSLRSGSFSFEDREKLLIASALGGMVIAQTGTVAVHSLGYPFTYYKGADHGLANGYLLGAFMEFIEKKDPALAARTLLPFGSKSAREFKKTLEELVGRAPALTGQEIEEYAQKASKTKNFLNLSVELMPGDLVGVLKNSL